MARHALGVVTVLGFALAAATAAAQGTPPPSPPAVSSMASEPAAEEPSADDLAASTAVLDASEPEPEAERTEKPARAAPSERSGRAAKFEITWSTLLTASGGEPETNLQLDEIGWRVEDLLRPRRHKLYPSTALSVYGEIDVADWLLFRGLFDTREIRDGATLEPPLSGVTINGNPALDELQSGSMLRELSAVIGGGGLTVEIGRFRADVAEGLVYEDFSSGLRVRADFEELGGAELRAELLLATVGQRVQDLDNNQVAALRGDWMLSPFEYVGAFVAVSNDDNGEISEVLRSGYAETLLGDQRQLTALFLQDQGSGRQGYLGLLTQLIVRESAVLRARLVLSGGTFKLRVPLETLETPEQFLDGREITVESSGLAADVELRFALNDVLEFSAFAFLLSGDEPEKLESGRYRSFVGLAPYWVWSGLFFSGGLAQGLYPNRASAAGINGRGVIGFGPALELDREPFTAEARAVLLRATAEPPEPPLGGTSRGYGSELDLRGEWRALPFMRVGAELDVFFPGEFFPSGRVAFLALLMVSLTNAQ